MPSRTSSSTEPRAAAPARRRTPARPRPRQLPPGFVREGLLAGVDEAGRGPLAGPVLAAAVILDDLRPVRGLADSKLLTPARRERLHDAICERALCVAVGQASVEEIDALNILQATLLAMRRAVEGLRLAPRHVLVDGDRLPVLTVHCKAVVGGDATVASIAAASIVAKVRRDRLCAELDAQWPHYGFGGHKGYATREHLAALRTHGACPAHRRSYAPVREVLGLLPLPLGPGDADVCAVDAPGGAESTLPAQPAAVPSCAVTSVAVPSVAVPCAAIRPT